MARRMAYICKAKACSPPHRIFAIEGDGVPECPAGHGTMEMQPNQPYRSGRTSHVVQGNAEVSSTSVPAARFGR